MVGQKWLWLAAVVLLVGLTILWYAAPVKEWLQTTEDQIKGLGALGPIVFGLGYIAAVVALVPAAPLTIAAGAAFGAWGFPLVVLAATLGATAAFLVARYVARERVAGFVQRRARLRAVDRAVAEDGWKVVALLRLSPLIPFNLQNYLFGVTDIPLRPYVAASFAGMIPGTLLYIYVGAAGKAAAGGGPMQWTFFAIGLFATALVAWLVGRRAKAQLARAGLEKKHK